jgi:hypothetical protein
MAAKGKQEPIFRVRKSRAKGAEDLSIRLSSAQAKRIGAAFAESGKEQPPASKATGKIRLK